MIATLIIAILIILNGLFVLAEFAIISAPKPLIEGKAQSGNKLAKKILKIINSSQLQDRYIGTAQLGITFASLGLGMYGEHVLAQWIHQQLQTFNISMLTGSHVLATILSISILTYLHIVLGEMIPKSIALQNSIKPLMYVTPIMLFISFILHPLVLLLNFISYSLLKILGINRELAATRFYSTDELELIVEKSQNSGLIHKDAGQVIKDLLKFGELTAYSVMTPRVHVTGIPINASLENIAQIISINPHTRYPVYQDNIDQIVGVIHIKDLLAMLVNKDSLQMTSIRKIPFVPESSDADTVFQRMREERSQMIIVMDEHGGTSGIITIEDLFDEVIGESNKDNLELNFTKSSPFLLAKGIDRLDEIAEKLDIKLDHDEVESVSGLILSILQRPPVVGDKIQYSGLEFKVLKVEGHGVSKCRIKIV